SFITQDPYDRDLLVKKLKPFDIPVPNYSGNRKMQNKPLVVSDMMHNLGITSRLDEVFEAPSVVKEVLISQAALDHSEEIVKNMRLERRKQQEMANWTDQRRRKLESMEKEEDLETTISRLTDMIGKLNVQRFKHAIEMK
ncbi:hypothetical protein KI387_009326, partial [Taxus chinensis]